MKENDFLLEEPEENSIEETVSSHEEGVCPVCRGVNLSYIETDYEGHLLSFRWECVQCGSTGKEWYSVVFQEHTIEHFND